MKSTALAFIFALAAICAKAQPQSELKVEPKTFIVAIDPDSAKAVCPKQGDVVKIKIVTEKSKKVFALNPRRPGEKYISSVPGDLSKVMNGGLRLVSGVTLEITTADGKTYVAEKLPLPAGTKHDILQVTCFYDKGVWTFEYFAD